MYQCITKSVVYRVFADGMHGALPVTVPAIVTNKIAGIHLTRIHSAFYIS